MYFQWGSTSTLTLHFLLKSNSISQAPNLPYWMYVPVFSSFARVMVERPKTDSSLVQMRLKKYTFYIYKNNFYS